MLWLRSKDFERNELVLIAEGSTTKPITGITTARPRISTKLFRIIPPSRGRASLRSRVSSSL
jgi:hypothetical protein